MNKKIALIFGSAGQDGSLMTLYLLKNGYKTYALSQSNKFTNLKSVTNNKNLIKKKISYKKKDLIKSIIDKSKCTEIYFFGGKSSPQFSIKNYNETLESHIIPVFNILQSIFELKKNKIKFFNTSSPEIFAKTQKKLHENSHKEPQNPYGLAKLDSYSLVKFFRENYQMNCFSGILFNHESNLRPNNFIIPKIIKYIKGKKFKKKLILGDLSAVKDFGWAEEYVQIINKLMKKNINEDIIIATGKSYKLSNIVKLIFEQYNMNWKKSVIFSRTLFRPGENKIMKANISKLKKLKISPKINLPEFINFLCNNDYTK
tara:strand:- start:1902 stop:2846 length:945 start_codon:yes stop_codon:yes gene_type:complete